jgi:hypothetical protein
LPLGNEKKGCKYSQVKALQNFVKEHIADSENVPRY